LWLIEEAIINGAKYIVCQKDRASIEYRLFAEASAKAEASSTKIILVENSSQAAAILAQARSGNPASNLINLAVTGTNGKTTVAFLVRSIIQTAGKKCGLISTIIYDTGLAISQATLTTPDCLDIAEAQSQMVKAGARYMVVEASSHALSQNRLAAINFKAAAFTNLGGDHLDYHKTKEDYLTAKVKLFNMLSADAIAVLNKQAPESKNIASHTKAKILWYAVDKPADISAHIESMDINGTIFTLEYAGQSSIVKTTLLGRHNVSNHLAAAGLCLAADFDLETIAVGLSSLQTISGRLEKIDWDGDFTVLIDYAHTDDALKNVLSTLKPLCKGKLRVVFGCGGDRDRTKRPRMARVVEQFADFIVVTSDNPRTEQPMNIINEIVTGFKKRPSIRTWGEGRETRDKQRLPRATCGEQSRTKSRGATKIIEPDRRKAIELAIKTAAKDDIVLIAGKGHENYQIIGKQKFNFDDKKVACEYLQEKQ